ncbi:DUF3187 family protein [bacterium]|nr:MAG: DUF3187 family protein [bacterium]
MVESNPIIGQSHDVGSRLGLSVTCGAQNATGQEHGEKQFFHGEDTAVPLHRRDRQCRVAPCRHAVRYNFFVLLKIGVLVLGLTGVAAAQESDWKGPLPVQNQRPLQANFLQFAPQSPETLPKGQSRLGFRFDIANNLLIPNPDGAALVQEDFETQRLTLNYRRGLRNGLEAEVLGSLVARNGGILDGPIEAYHRLLGLDGDGEDNPQGRDNISKGRSVFSFDDGNGNRINRGSDFGLGDTTFSLKKGLSSGNFTSVARVGVKIPTASSGKLLGSGGVDFGVTLDARYRLAPEWALFVSAGVLKFGSSDIPNSKSSGLQGGLGFEWRKSARESFVAQIDAATRTVTTENSFADGTPVLASVGYKRRVGQDKLFWASFSENGDYHNFNAPFFGNVGPDFTLTIGYQMGL